jgi:hypothetical protein
MPSLDLDVLIEIKTSILEIIKEEKIIIIKRRIIIKGRRI